jgi:hypothetical protein
MKKLMVMITRLTSLNALADIDEASMKSMEPKAGEVESSRSCFQELETFGCRHPREDMEQFRSCMDNILSSLTPSCQRRVKDLYGKKK